MVCALIPAKDDIDLLFGALRNAALVVHPLSLCLPKRRQSRKLLDVHEAAMQHTITTAYSLIYLDHMNEADAPGEVDEVGKGE